MLARHAARRAFPIRLSTVAARTPEDLRGVLGDQGWFQLYPPRDPEIRATCCPRAGGGVSHAGPDGGRARGLPAGTPDARRPGAAAAPHPALLAQVAPARPGRWGCAHGMPRMRLIDSYAPPTKGACPRPRIWATCCAAPGLGLCGGAARGLGRTAHPQGRDGARDRGARRRPRGSTRSGSRTMRAASSTARPPASTRCREIRAATDLPLIFDSGIEGGLDILRALALGADFVMMGRAGTMRWRRWARGSGASARCVGEGHGVEHGADRDGQVRRPRGGA
jgi:L-lactate dehydrogenase (cytochrome)